MGKVRLTSIKLLEGIYKAFKVLGIQNDITLQRLTNRSIYLYTTDAEYRARIDGMLDLHISGSSF